MSKETEERPFTVDDVDKWLYPRERLVDILNGEYDLKEAREDLRSLINVNFFQDTTP
jgi:hypothetical protein